MIDRIIRKSINEYVIIYTHRSPVSIWSTHGKARELLELLLYGKF